MALALPAAGQKLLVVDLDDLGTEFLDANPTPFFTALEQVGRTYRRFYTAPVCSPTRAQVTYGVRASHPDLRAPWLTDYFYGGGYATPTDGRLVPLPRALGRAGVSTAKVGKHHLCPKDRFEHPNALGWDRYVGVMGNVRNYFEFLENEDGVETRVDQVGHPGVYLPVHETDRAIDAMAGGFDLVWLSMHLIHDPYHVPPSTLFPDAIDTSTDHGKARAMLWALDSQLWRLAASAVQRDYDLILFSDNGSLPLLGGEKGNVSEAGCRTRMWVWSPGIQAGDDTSLVGALDLYATILDYFHVPRGPDEGPQSISFLPTVAGAPGLRDSLFLERFQKNGIDPELLPFEWTRAVVGPTHKLRIREQVTRLHALPDETFDVLSDGISPAEQALLDALEYELYDYWTGL